MKFNYLVVNVIISIALAAIHLAALTDALPSYYTKASGITRTLKNKKVTNDELKIADGELVEIIAKPAAHAKEEQEFKVIKNKNGQLELIFSTGHGKENDRQNLEVIVKKTSDGDLEVVFVEKKNTHSRPEPRTREVLGLLAGRKLAYSQNGPGTRLYAPIGHTKDSYKSRKYEMEKENEKDDEEEDKEYNYRPVHRRNRPETSVYADMKDTEAYKPKEYEVEYERENNYRPTYSRNGPGTRVYDMKETDSYKPRKYEVEKKERNYRPRYINDDVNSYAMSERRYEAKQRDEYSGLY